MRYLFFLFAFTCSTIAVAQSTQKGTVAIKGMVAAKRFVFRAQSTTTSGGDTRQLSGSYAITILPDSIISELPYYGRMYQAPMNSEDNGINFTSLKFEYIAKDHKKGGWDIHVKTVDVKNTPQLFLTVYPKGTATLRINCIDRQSATYVGFIQEVGKK